MLALSGPFVSGGASCSPTPRFAASPTKARNKGNRHRADSGNDSLASPAKGDHVPEPLLQIPCPFAEWPQRIDALLLEAIDEAKKKHHALQVDGDREDRDAAQRIGLRITNFTNLNS